MEVAGQQSVGDLMRLNIERNAASTFLVFEPEAGETQTLTYGAFAARAFRVANALVARGLAQGDKVAILLGNNPEFLVAWFAVQLAGGVATPSTRSIRPTNSPICSTTPTVWR
jgi:acyl-CoA synthetase (AMP-forming)/AMP-acid ligase II